jgi:hypothetical protein
MSEQQQKFDNLMKRTIKVSPEELKRRLAESETRKPGRKDTPKNNEGGDNEH